MGIMPAGRLVLAGRIRQSQESLYAKFNVQPMNKRRDLTYNTRTDRNGRTLNHKDDTYASKQENKKSN